jgi:hypothetical protein
MQQIAAQIRCLRATDETHDTVLAVVQAPQLSWPTFRRETPRTDLTDTNTLPTLPTNQVGELEKGP